MRQVDNMCQWLSNNGCTICDKTRKDTASQWPYWHLDGSNILEFYFKALKRKQNYLDEHLCYTKERDTEHSPNTFKALGSLDTGLETIVL